MKFGLSHAYFHYFISADVLALQNDLISHEISSRLKTPGVIPTVRMLQVPTACF